MTRRILAALAITAGLSASAARAQTQSPFGPRISLDHETVRWGEPVTLELSAANPHYATVQGGLTVSFSSNVIIVPQDGNSRIYYENSEIFRSGHRETMASRDIMVESWFRHWPSGTFQNMRVGFFPIRTGVLTVRIRAAFITDLASRSVINLPVRSDCVDQQGYPAVCKTIFVKDSPDFIRNLQLIVNSTDAGNPELLKNLQTLIDNPEDKSARSFFGIDAKTSLGYLDSYLQALAGRLKDPKIRQSPDLMKYLRRLVNEPTDREALRFFGVDVVEAPPPDPDDKELTQCRGLIEALKGGTALMSLIRGEKGLQMGCSRDRSRIALLHGGERHWFELDPSPVRKIVLKIIEIKPEATYRHKKEPFSGYSFEDLARELAP